MARDACGLCGTVVTPDSLDYHVNRFHRMMPDAYHALVGGFAEAGRKLAELEAAHARCTNLTNAEASRIFTEAREMRERAEQSEAERDALAAIVGVECPIADLTIVESLRVASAHAGQYAEAMQAERDDARAALAAYATPRIPILDRMLAETVEQYKGSSFRGVTFCRDCKAEGAGALDDEAFVRLPHLDWCRVKLAADRHEYLVLWQHAEANLRQAAVEAEEDRAALAASEAYGVELRKMIVDSATVCTLTGCQHCKWLGWNLGRYESLALEARRAAGAEGAGEAAP